MAPASRRGFVSRLTAKVGPLPVWAWAAVILGAYFLYSRMRPPAAATMADTASASTPDGSTGAAQVPASGQGGAPDNLSGDLLAQLGQSTAAIDALTAQVLNSSAFGGDFGDAPMAGSIVSAPAAQPTTAAPTTTTPQQVGASAGHATQTAAGVLKWGGVSFTTKSAFNRWAKEHGTTAAAELKSHPQARAVYGTLSA